MFYLFYLHSEWQCFICFICIVNGNVLFAWMTALFAWMTMFYLFYLSEWLFNLHEWQCFICVNDNALFARGCRLFHLSSQSLPTMFFFLALVSSPGSFSLPVRFIMHTHTLSCALNNPISSIKLGAKTSKTSQSKGIHQRRKSVTRDNYCFDLRFDLFTPVPLGGR